MSCEEGVGALGRVCNIGDWRMAFLVRGVSVLHGSGMGNVSTIPFFEWEGKCACEIQLLIARLSLGI